MATVQDVLAVAQKYADTGYKEGKNNDSIFGDWYGLPNNPWCAMFVSYCFNKAGAGKLVGPAKKGFASCTTGMEWLSEHGTKVAPSKAQAGDIVFFQWDSGSPDHVGIVLSSHPNTRTLKTVEGNTGAPKGAKGEGVYYKTRSYAVVEAIYRPNWARVAPKPTTPTPPATPVEPVKPVAPTTPLEPTKPVAPVSPATPAPVKPQSPKPVYTVVKAGDGYWTLAARVLNVANVAKNYLKIAKESKRLQALNGKKALNPGDKIRIK